MNDTPRNTHTADEEATILASGLLPLNQLRVLACIRACEGVPTEQLTDGLLRVLVRLLARLADDAHDWMADANGLPLGQYCPPCRNASDPCPICEARALLVGLEPTPAAPSAPALTNSKLEGTETET